MHGKTNSIPWAQLFAFACANTALYGLPYMKSQFYDFLMEVLKLNHTQLSTLFSLFGMGCMATYLIGGFLSDRFPVKKIMLSALIISGCLHFYVITVPSYDVLCFIFFAFSITAVLMFYPASMKALSRIGGNSNQGKTFGYYIALIDILGIVIVGFGLLIFHFSNDVVITFRFVIATYGGLHFIAALMLATLYNDPIISTRGETIDWKQVKNVAVSSSVWMVIIAFFCNYLILSALTYVTPLLTDVYQANEEAVLLFSLIRVNLIAIAASVIGGKAVDRVHSAIKFIKMSFIVSIVALILVLMSFHTRLSILFLMIVILGLSAPIMAAKSVNMVMISEIKLPPAYGGTAIGLISFLGFSPDAFFYTLAGSLIDNYGKFGYEIVFLLCLLASFAGCWACHKLIKHNSMASTTEEY